MKKKIIITMVVLLIVIVAIAGCSQMPVVDFTGNWENVSNGNVYSFTDDGRFDEVDSGGNQIRKGEYVLSDNSIYLYGLDFDHTAGETEEIYSVEEDAMRDQAGNVTLKRKQ